MDRVDACPAEGKALVRPVKVAKRAGRPLAIEDKQAGGSGAAHCRTGWAFPCWGRPQLRIRETLTAKDICLQELVAELTLWIVLPA